MATDTDIRLRSRLDSNQRDREQMCRAVLSLDARYTEVRPRHPLGGRDGGRDIEAHFGGALKTFGAVGFANSANDSDEQKKKIRRKFKDDLKSAMAAEPAPKAFVFLTNVHFTMGEQDEMKKEASNAGIEHCDILDRERLRIELDSPSGFFIRFQYLGIPLSEAEQASFLSRYGAQIQDVVTSGFQKVEKTLDRLLFLSEARDPLDALSFRFVLKKPYLASEIGHFRAFVFLTLNEFRPGMHTLWFGSSDKSDRFRDDLDDKRRDTTAGIGNGIGSGQWELYLPADLESYNQKAEDAPVGQDASETAKIRLEYEQTSWTSGRGLDPVQALVATYRHADCHRPPLPTLALRNLEDGMFLPFVNGELADKIHSIQVFANGYKLADFGPSDFRIDRSRCGESMPTKFSDAEMADPWVRLRPTSMNSAYRFRFGEVTPKRTYGHEQPIDSPPPPELS
ncbi:hypothetical protein [Sphingomonas sp. CV7422]|uniref:hypothetical protein n=1 Tax=Sphingomonas sp. CV7422 TaxID=3018036 RepID=UPI0022FF4343|nr:hypothetical protein [Sphingomonas sp. CV7422]